MPRTPLEETVPEFRARLKGICDHINNNRDVEGLGRELPMRLHMLVDAKGDRIDK